MANSQKITSKEINRNFRIKVYGNGFDTLVGVSGLRSFIDEPLFDRLLQRAFSSKLDKCVCRLRRGITITFYYK